MYRLDPNFSPWGGSFRNHHSLTHFVMRYIWNQSCFLLCDLIPQTVIHAERTRGMKTSMSLECDKFQAMYTIGFRHMPPFCNRKRFYLFHVRKRTRLRAKPRPLRWLNTEVHLPPSLVPRTHKVNGDNRFPPSCPLTPPVICGIYAQIFFKRNNLR